ncbi:hypothetical protein PG997_014351 [Apiospora hydei]|uniref:RING-type domain-containing protein n=1 Tax=Apiospora hydei TaxID=1337664 RepID=A0ABR1UWP2_9PEZI
MSSSNSPPAGTEVIETCWIQDVAAYMGKAGQSGEPVLSCTCVICQDSILDISTCVGDMIKEELAAARPVDSKEAFYKKYNLEHSVFLRCGHILGHSCFEQYAEAAPILCPICRENNYCDGCGLVQIALTSNFIVPWPLSIDGHDPYQYFMSHVPRTKAEIAPGTKLFCEDCLKKQVIRGWAKLALLCPTCPACDAARVGEGAAEKYPEDHRLWRRGKIDRWIRQQLCALSELVLPSRADLRERDHEAQLFMEQQLARRRDNWVDNYMYNEDLVGPLRRILFWPCEQDRERGDEEAEDEEEDETGPLSQADFYALDRAMRQILADRLQGSYEPALMWFRGDDRFEWNRAAEAGPKDPSPRRQMFAEITGTETFIQALFFVNPLWQ